ncbi:hypothetical protein GCM10010400_72260 [Streptomyces aculeolatus]
MHHISTMDLGPNAFGWSIKIGEDILVAVSPDVLQSPTAQQAVRELAKRQGVEVTPTCSCSRTNAAVHEVA